MVKKEDYSKYFFVFFVLLMIGLVYLVVKPFITALLGSIFLAYLFYPLYRWLNKKVKVKSLCALIVSLIVVILLIVPLFFVVNTLTREAYVSYLTSKQKLLAMGDFFKNCPEDNPFCGFVSYIGDFLDEPKVKYHLENTIEKVASYVIDRMIGRIRRRMASSTKRCRVADIRNPSEGGIAPACLGPDGRQHTCRQRCTR